MKLTLSWLKEHLETEASLDQITTALTALGLEVDAVHDPMRELAPFVIASVLEAEQHPNADRLRVCKVDFGGDTVMQVVCGAPNARAGMKGVFAPPGSHIPGTGLDLKKGVIRGVESNGMLVSEREMGLSDEHNGIIDLAADAPVGTPFAEYLGLDDPVIEIGLTPDRADCAGIRGIARDLAAAGLGRLVPLPVPEIAAGEPCPISVTLAFPEAERDACPLFLGRVIRGVKNGPSPEWLQRRLTAIGLRPISLLVDITNYFTFDRNRPLHVFDADKIAGNALTVRLSRAGETLEALNEKTYTLPDGITVIVDGADRVESLGGIMGGAPSGVTEDTTTVFLEAAYFDPTRTALSGRLLEIHSDARYRFERGIDPQFTREGLDQATAMILALAGGTASDPVVAGAEPAWQRQYPLRPSRVAALGGLDVARDRQVQILEALGFTVSPGADDTLAVAVPPWRPDVHGEADLVEEVLRVVGYDAIPSVSMPRSSAVTRPAITAAQRRAGLARRTLATRGLDEAVTWSFVDDRQAATFGWAGDEALRLVNPISTELSIMRPSALPGLIHAARRNADRGYGDAALFEVGPAYRDTTPKGQDLVAAGIRTGRTAPRHWAESPRPVEVFDAKADALAVLEALGAPVANAQISADAPSWYHPGRSGQLRLGATVLARFGEIHPRALQALDAGGPVAAFEVFLDAVPAPKKKPGTAKSMLRLSAFQPVERDFAFLVAADVPADKVVRAAKGADKQLIGDVTLFDDYRGSGVSAGQKSLAIAVTLQPTEKTLTEEEIEAVAAKVVQAVEKQAGGVLRS